MLKPKKTLLKTSDAIDLMMGDSLALDVRSILSSQRKVTNDCWVYMLESGECRKVVERLLKTYISDEYKRSCAARDITVTLSRGKTLQTLAAKKPKKQS